MLMFWFYADIFLAFIYGLAENYIVSLAYAMLAILAYEFYGREKKQKSTAKKV